MRKINKNYFLFFELEKATSHIANSAVLVENSNAILIKNVNKFSDDTKLACKLLLQGLFKEKLTEDNDEKIYENFCKACEVIIFNSRTVFKKELQERKTGDCDKQDSKRHVINKLDKADSLLSFNENAIYEYIKSIYPTKIKQKFVNKFNKIQDKLDLQHGYLRELEIKNNKFPRKELCLIGYYEDYLFLLKYRHERSIDSLLYGGFKSLDKIPINLKHEKLLFGKVLRNYDKSSAYSARMTMQDLCRNKYIDFIEIQSFEHYFNMIQYEEIDILQEKLEKKIKTAQVSSKNSSNT